MKLVIGTRDSKLALVQTYWVRDQLLKLEPKLNIEIKEIKTKGDIILDTALSKIGDKGLFVKELEQALLTDEIDLAVHSMKDLETKITEGLEVKSVGIREDVRDVVCFSEKTKQELKITSLTEANNLVAENKIPSFNLGTSSLRRIAQLKDKYPNLNFIDIRGNLQTRFNKLNGTFDYPAGKEAHYDAIVLAAAGIKRLGQEKLIDEYLQAHEILPAVAQGALAVEYKAGKQKIIDIISKLCDKQNEQVVIGERAFLRTLEGGCQIPIGIYSEILETKQIKYSAVYFKDGKKLKAEISGDISASEHLGNKLAKQFI